LTIADILIGTNGNTPQKRGVFLYLKEIRSQPTYLDMMQLGRVALFVQR